MLRLEEALEYCGFDNDSKDSPYADDEVWRDGPRFQDAIGVPDDWVGWEVAALSWWREYPEGGDVAFDEVVFYSDRIIIIDRTHKRMATTCLCEPDGCNLAAELVRSWFASGR